MSARFNTKKHKILAALSRPDTDYTDASPKGFVDDGVRELIGQINDAPGFVTTSSCAGRIAVYLEGPPKLAATPSPVVEGDETAAVGAGGTAVASASGKGGGRWLFSSHAPVDLSSVSKTGALLRLFGFSSSSEVSFPLAGTRPQFVHLKFEPMVCLAHPIYVSNSRVRLWSFLQELLVDIYAHQTNPS
jgi:tRNA wybutosine-synthesizing protein 3